MSTKQPWLVFMYQASDLLGGFDSLRNVRVISLDNTGILL